jgi:hypothetical protein
VRVAGEDTWTKTQEAEQDKTCCQNRGRLARHEADTHEFQNDGCAQAELYRKIDRLQTEVHLLGSMAGIMLSLLGQLGWRQVEQAIIQGLTDAAASVPARSEADWDRFMVYIRQQGAAVTVTKTRTETSSIPLQPIRRPASPR